MMREYVAIGSVLGTTVMTLKQLRNRDHYVAPLSGAFLNLCGSFMGAAAGAVAWFSVHDRQLTSAVMWMPMAVGVAVGYVR